MSEYFRYLLDALDRFEKLTGAEIAVVLNDETFAIKSQSGAPFLITLARLLEGDRFVDPEDRN